MDEQTSEATSGQVLKQAYRHPTREEQIVVQVNGSTDKLALRVGKRAGGQAAERADKEEGELLIRSPLVTRGYFRNEKATADAFKDGWFCSGDVGIRRNGKFYVVDRKKVRCSS